MNGACARPVVLKLTISMFSNTGIIFLSFLPDLTVFFVLVTINYANFIIKIKTKMGLDLTMAVALDLYLLAAVNHLAALLMN